MSLEVRIAVPGKSDFGSNSTAQPLSSPGNYIGAVSAVQTVLNSSPDSRSLMFWIWGNKVLTNVPPVSIGEHSVEISINGGAWATVAGDTVDVPPATQPVLVKEQHKLVAGSLIGFATLSPGASLTLQARSVVTVATASGASWINSTVGVTAWLI